MTEREREILKERDRQRDREKKKRGTTPVNTLIDTSSNLLFVWSLSQHCCYESTHQKPIVIKREKAREKETEKERKRERERDRERKKGRGEPLNTPINSLSTLLSSWLLPLL